MVPSVVSEIYNNLGWVYVKLNHFDEAEKCFKRAISKDSLNIKAVRNSRAIGKLEARPDTSKKQTLLGLFVLSSIVGSYYFFWIEKISETVFATQSIVLIALIIFIALYSDLGKFKAYGIEFEKSSEHRYIEAKSQSAEIISKIER